jgi:succinoglycan biosynthesis transport protein ExoP
MTTLPQTTPIRLPRAGGNSQMSMPTSMVAPQSVVAQGPGMSMSGGDVWRVIRANLWLIILFVALGGTGGYFLNGYLEQHDSAYTASGQVRILPQQSPDPLHPAPMVGDPNSLGIEMATEMNRFKSEGLVDDMLKDLDNPIRQLNWWKITCGGNPDRAHELLGQNLSVEPKVGSQLMKISFTAPDKSDTPVIVTAVVERAIADQRDFIRDKYDADRKRIADLKNRYEIQLRQATDDVKSKVEELDRDGGDTRGGASSKDIELNRRVEEQISLESQKLSIDNAYTAYKEKKDKGETLPRVAEMVDQDADIIRTKEAVDSITMRMNDIRSDSGPKSPAWISLEKSLENEQKHLDDLKAEKTDQYTSSYESNLLGERETINQQKNQIDSQVASLKSELAEIANKYAALRSREDDKAVCSELVKQYDKALQDMDQMVRIAAYGSLAWFEHPREPTVRSFPKLSVFLPMGIMIGLGLSLGIAFLREVTDTTVRSPRDIVRVGQMTLLGMVPHESDDPQSSGARLPLVIFEAPHSIMAEQLRQVRTRLQHAASLDTTRSILVTSPSPGDGKSTIAVNLAAGLALNGRRILLVDSNFRRPELHRIFGVGNEAGFSDVLNDVNAFSQNVRETPVPNLSVMSSGPKPSNPTELLESQLLLDFIERALEEYDHVIFDSGPMLFVSESVALAPRVDGVITVVKARTSSRGVLTRMRDGLRAVKAEHLGVVLNAVRSQAGGYYGRSIKTYYEYQNVD